MFNNIVLPNKLCNNAYYIFGQAIWKYKKKNISIVMNFNNFT